MKIPEKIKNGKEGEKGLFVWDLKDKINELIEYLEEREKRLINLEVAKWRKKHDTPTPVRHVNPECKDSSKCEPHGETGPVTYKQDDEWSEFDEEFTPKDKSLPLPKLMKEYNDEVKSFISQHYISKKKVRDMWLMCDDDGLEKVCNCHHAIRELNNGLD